MSDSAPDLDVLLGRIPGAVKAAAQFTVYAHLAHTAIDDQWATEDIGSPVDPRFVRQVYEIATARGFDLTRFSGTNLSNDPIFIDRNYEGFKAWSMLELTEGRELLRRALRRSVSPGSFLELVRHSPADESEKTFLGSDGDLDRAVFALGFAAIDLDGADWKFDRSGRLRPKSGNIGYAALIFKMFRPIVAAELSAADVKPLPPERATGRNISR